MAIADIQTQVWKLMQVASPTSADNTMLLAAINYARQDAERKRDWVASETVGYLAITAETGSLLSATKASYSSVVQVETATVVGTITGNGNATVIITSTLVTGSPLTVSVAVLNGDTPTTTAGKIGAALQALSAITDHYTVGGTSGTVTLTALVAAANDTTLNISINNGTCTGLTPALTSANTTEGSALRVPTGDALSVKQIRWLRTWESTSNSSGYAWIPGRLMNKSTYEELLVAQNRTGYPVWTNETSGVRWDESALPETRNLVFRDGLTLYTLRDTSVNVQLWCWKWLAAYASFSAPDDFLITYGSDYLMWAAICVLNKEKGVFLPRNEGSLTEDSPLAMRELAWQSLVEWDSGLKNNQDFILA